MSTSNISRQFEQAKLIFMGSRYCAALYAGTRYVQRTAIKGGCVTRRKHPGRSWYFRQRTVTVQGGYGVLFAFKRGVCEVEPCRDTMPNASQKIITGYKTGFGHRSSVAVQAFSEPEICHDARTKLRAAARVRMHGHYEFV